MPGLESLAGTAAGATPYGAIAEAASGLIKGGIGIWQNIKGNKLLKKLQTPTEVIPSAIKENKAQAELDANTGLPQEQYNNSIKNLQRNQMAALSSGADRRTGLSLITALNDNANNATADLDAADAQARLQNKRQLQTVNNNYGQWQNKVWQNNVKEPFERDREYAMSLKGQGGSNIVSGADSLVSGGLSYGASGGFGRPNNSSGVGVDDGNDMTGLSNEWLFKNRKRKY